MGTRRFVALAALLLVVGAACGDDSDDDGGADDPDSSEPAPTEAGVPESTVSPEILPACDTVDPAVVADLFGGTEAEPQSQGDSCAFAVSGGLVEVVALVDPEPASETWLNRKTLLEQGGQAEGGVEYELVDVEGVGDEAYTFTPVDREPQLMVRTGTMMFSVGFKGDETPEAMAALEQFALHIVDYVAEQEDS